MCIYVLPIAYGQYNSPIYIYIYICTYVYIYVGNLRPLLYHDFLKNLVRDNFENMVPGIFKRYLNKTCIFRNYFENGGSGPRSLAQNGSGPGPGPAPAAILGSGTWARAHISQKYFGKDVFFKHILKIPGHIFSKWPLGLIKVFRKLKTVP